ncbi:sodium channel protein Nach-like [Culex pipiens pallens]|uniref:sodium channel protein Nach-like n=1 Tax=Culex pipiens pallens TaxID=42434 RepID=UPI001952CD2D|nr:sodium channel protein Nach-like [Culex pipiens pallens]
MEYEFPISKFIRRVVEKTSLHGVFHLTNAKSVLIEKLFWASIILSVIVSSIYLVALFWVRYLTNPTVISLDRNYHEWNATFPSLTVCFHDRLNLTARDALTNRVNPKDPAKFKRFLATLAEAHLFRLEQLIEFDEYSDLDLKSVLNQISNVVDAEVVLENGLKAKLHRVITDLGICYTFNSAILQFLSVEPLSDEDLRSGLVEISIIERDTAATLSNLTSNGDIYYHGPFEAPTVLKKLLVKTAVSSFLTMTFKPVTVTADSTIENLYVQQRNCRFPHESNLEFFVGFYTNSLCMLECRLKLCLDFCGCVPHFYNTAVRLPICPLKRLRCLVDNNVKIRQGLASCRCLKDCNSIGFTLQNYVLFDWFKAPLIKWDMEFQKVRYSRRIIFGFADAMVSTGGICGLFFGASFVTVVELCYLFLRNILK